jgi:hypothetical protein
MHLTLLRQYCVLIPPIYKIFSREEAIAQSFFIFGPLCPARGILKRAGFLRKSEATPVGEQKFADFSTG